MCAGVPPTTEERKTSMMHRRICTWTLLATLSFVATVHAADDFIAAQPLSELGLLKYWQLELPLEKDQQLDAFYRVDDALYAATNDGYCYALDAATGVIRWLRPITRSGYRVRPPAHVGDNVYFLTPIDAQIYERRSGDPVRRRSLRFPPGTPPVADDVHVFVGGLNRRMYALDAATLYTNWRVITDGAFTARPATYGDWLFMANDNGTVYACTRDNKSFHWQAQTYGPVEADLVATDQGVLVASRDLSLYHFNLYTGEVRWRARFTGQLTEAPVVTETLVYQFCAEDGLGAVEMEQIGVEERIRWKLPNGHYALTPLEDNIIVLGRDETLMAVRTRDGTVQHTASAPGFTLAVPSVADTTVFIASPDGRLFCARPKGTPPLTTDDIHAAQGGKAAEVETADGPTTQPALEIPEEPLRSRRKTIVGGKSKVTKEFKEDAESQ